MGQGFAAELFQVWTGQNDGVSFEPVNMNAAVEFMVRRGLEGGDSSELSG